MTPEQFIANEITRGDTSAEAMASADEALCDFRRNSYTDLEELIKSARRKIVIKARLPDGVTAAEFADLIGCSHTTGRKILNKLESDGRCVVNRAARPFVYQSRKGNNDT